MRLLTVLSGAALLCASVTALAESPPATTSSSGSTLSSELRKQVNRVKRDCGPDIDKLCKNVNPGDGRIAACLDSKSDQLSPICKDSYDRAQASISAKIDQQELAFRDSCSGDIQKFCADVPSGKGRLLDCIGRNKESLSPSCQNYRNSLEQQLGGAIG